MARRIAVVNQKGGVGKTTTAVNLAASLASRGLRVLLLDYDPQSNASQFLGFAGLLAEARVERRPLYTSADLTLGVNPVQPLDVEYAPCLKVIPATEQLAFIERDLLADVLAGARRLSAALRRIEADYDYIVADCPPTLGMISFNAIIACPEILIPVDLAPASMPGALQLRDHLASLRERLEPNLRILGVLGTFYAESAKKPREMLSALQDIFGDRVFTTFVHTAQAVRDSAGTGKPIVLADPASRAAQEYNALTDEVVARA